MVMEDVKILRQLAWDYKQIAADERNAERMRLHVAVNDLQPIRPVVILDELPWSELNINDELTMRCSDPFLRSIEWFFRSLLFRIKHMPGDLIVPPYVPVHKIIESTGIGISVEEEILATDSRNGIVSHKYADILETEADLDRQIGRAHV